MDPTQIDGLFNKNLRDRNVVPRTTEDPNNPDSPRYPQFHQNIQGDVFPMFPKEVENFIFFTISDVPKFKKALAKFDPTTSHDVLTYLVAICQEKEKPGQTVRVGLAQTQIAFSRAGLVELKIEEPIEDDHFDKGPMLGRKGELGSTGDWDDVFYEGMVHGVVIVASSDLTRLETKTDKIKECFGSSIKILTTISGKVRVDPHQNREHFGYRDGISQPALRGLVKPHAGQIEVDPGVIIMGYKGDPVFDNPKAKKRPEWTKDGSIMVFQKLEQDVIEFEKYLTENGRRLVNPSDEKFRDEKKCADLFGARLMGRWKSGVPLALAPSGDNPELVNDPDTKGMDKINNFNYLIDGIVSDRDCPFTAHTRKTVPRNLDPYIQKKFLESSMIVRAGIPYGDEVSPDERQGRSSKKRGLLFACYQSCLKNGFYRVAIGFGANDYFPITSIERTRHGQDPIIGGPAPVVNVYQKCSTNIAASSSLTLRIRGWFGNDIEVSGSTTKQPENTQDFFVTSRGGEHFFVPSIKTLKRWGTA